MIKECELDPIKFTAVQSATDEKSKKTFFQRKFGRFFKKRNTLNEMDFNRLSIKTDNFSGKENPFGKPNLASSSSKNVSTERTANATGSGRNKVALKPGHSLMDWIRLANSKQDLRCGSDGNRRISGKELAQHNKQTDAWTAVNGTVYNITPYLEFHPGGINELMRAAGKDCTNLFNQVHSWVNFESMLNKCSIGFLIRGPDVIVAELDPVESKTETLTKEVEPSNNTIEPIKFIHPSYDWHEENLLMKLVLINLPSFDYTRVPAYVAQILDHQILSINFKVDQNFIYKIHLKLAHKIKLPIEFKQAGNNTEIILNKEDPIQWHTIGSHITFDNSLIAESEIERDSHEFVLLEKRQLTHDSFLFILKAPNTCQIKIKYCEHVLLKFKNSSVTRFYTPVPANYFFKEQNEQLPDTLYLVIKLYENGLMSNQLRSMVTGQTILVSDPYSIQLNIEQILNSREKFFLIAAGTGITPILNVIQRLKELSQQCAKYAKLLFFNRTSKDVLLEDKLNQFALSDCLFNFSFLNYFSQSREENFGKISEEIIRNQILKYIEDESKCYIFICGSNGFILTTASILDSLGLNKSSLVHVFVE